MNDSTLEAYILEEHTDQLKTLRDRVHNLSNLLIKEEQVWNSIEKNINNIISQLEKINERVNQLEQTNKIRESKFFIVKEYWPLLLFIFAVVDYSKIMNALKSFLHLG